VDQAEAAQENDEDIDLAPRRASRANRANKAGKARAPPRAVQKLVIIKEPHPMLGCDIAQKDDDLSVPEHSTDILSWYRECEDSAFSRNLIKLNYMSPQFHPELTESMRSTLVNWLFNVHRRFKLCPRTLYMGIYVMDSFLSLVSVRRDQLQLVGSAALWVSSKYTDIYAPLYSDFTYISDHAFSVKDLFQTEVEILVKLKFRFADIITPLHFLERYLQIISFPLLQKYQTRGTVQALRDGQRYLSLIVEMAHYFNHLVLFDCTLLCATKPSKLASAAMCFTVLSISLYRQWPAFLEKGTGYKYRELHPVLMRIELIRKHQVEGKFKALDKIHQSVKKWLNRLNIERVLTNGRGKPAKTKSTGKK